MTIEVGTKVRWTETGTVIHVEFEATEDAAPRFLRTSPAAVRVACNGGCGNAR